MVKDPTNGFGLAVGVSEIAKCEPRRLLGGSVIEPQSRKRRELSNQIGPKPEPSKQTPRRVREGVGTTPIEQRLARECIDEVNGMTLLGQPQRQQRSRGTSPNDPKRMNTCGGQ